MTSPHTIERQRGAKEAGQQLAVLREKWPLAFPLHNARPLALGTVGQIAEAMGWTVPYVIGVLTYWKMAPFYCQAVLAHDQRITLDGEPARTGRRRGEGFSDQAVGETCAIEAVFKKLNADDEAERARRDLGG